MSQESKSQDQLNTSSHAAEEEDEETLMQRALELSMREAAGDVSASVVSSSSAVMETEDLDEVNYRYHERFLILIYVI